MPDATYVFSYIISFALGLFIVIKCYKFLSLKGFKRPELWILLTSVVITGILVSFDIFILGNIDNNDYSYQPNIFIGIIIAITGSVNSLCWFWFIVRVITFILNLLKSGVKKLMNINSR